MLAPVYAKLNDRNASGPSAPVRILQIGDSHTAGDAITGAWRQILQGRYGSGGRGVLPPGHPYDGYLPRGVQVVQAGRWRADAIFGPDRHAGGAPVGISGFSMTSQGEGASFAIDAQPGEAFDTLIVCALVEPGAGALQLTAGGQSISVPINAGAERLACPQLTTSAPTLSAQVRVLGPSVTVTSWATFRAGQGVSISNVGVVGAQFQHFARTDDQVVRKELEAYRPDLIAIEYGTNEAFAGIKELAHYEADLRSGIERLKRLAPSSVAFLLIGAPDSATRRSDLVDAANRSASACPAADALGSQTPGPAAAAGAPWMTPSALATIRDVQRRVAHEENLAYWDWSAALGGRCTSVAWAASDPRLMRADHVHFTTLGGERAARQLVDDLDDAVGRPLRDGAAAPQ